MVVVVSGGGDGDDGGSPGCHGGAGSIYVR